MTSISFTLNEILQEKELSNFTENKPLQNEFLHKLIVRKVKHLVSSFSLPLSINWTKNYSTSKKR